MLPLAPAAGTMQRTVVACSSARMVYVLLQRAPAVSPLCSKSGRKLQQQRPLCTEAPPSGEGAAKGTATAKGKVKDVMVVGAGVAGQGCFPKRWTLDLLRAKREPSQHDEIQNRSRADVISLAEMAAWREELRLDITVRYNILPSSQHFS